MDGKRVAYLRPVAGQPGVSGLSRFETVMGGGDLNGAGNALQGFRGHVDAVRVWDYVRSGIEIQQARGQLLPEFAGMVVDPERGPTMVFNFDDAGTLEDVGSLPGQPVVVFAGSQDSVADLDWRTGWMHAAEVDSLGGVTQVAAPWPPVDLDSDDNWITDRDEHAEGWPTNRSEIPLRYHVLDFDANAGDVLVDELVDSEETMLFGLEQWTVEAWVRPEAGMPMGMAPVVRRETAGSGRITFELGVTNNGSSLNAYARFQRNDGSYQFVTLSSSVPLIEGEWMHLATTFRAGKFSLFVDGGEQRIDTDVTAQPYVGGLGRVYLGSQAYIGQLSDVRIWNAPRTQQEIRDGHRDLLLFTAAQMETSFHSQVSSIERTTSTQENGWMIDDTELEVFEAGFTYLAGQRTHAFALEAWVKMDPGATGGIVVERVVDDPSIAPGVAMPVSHSLRINDGGNPQGVWQMQVTTYEPVREEITNADGTTSTFLARIDTFTTTVTRDLTTSFDVRDGQWHHLALVGDGDRVRLFVDGALEREVGSYYTFQPVAGENFEGYFETIAPINSTLRVGADGLDALIDEVMVWNESLGAADVRRHMDFGLDTGELRAAVSPLVATDAGTGADTTRQRLVSYVTFDGELEFGLIPDLANEEIPYRILPAVSGTELVTPSSPPVSVDRVRSFQQQLRGYFAAVDGGAHVENYMLRNVFGFAGAFRGTAGFAEFQPEDMAHMQQDSSGDGLPDWWKTLYGLDPGSSTGDHGRYGDPDGDGLPNIAEYLAGTDPTNWDTYNDGFSDYDSYGPGQVQPWGQLYTDWDGMADAWEAQYAPYLSPSLYDAHLDADGDGWSNYAEFMAGTNPVDVGEYPRPPMRVRFLYEGANDQGELRIKFYDHPGMDGKPVAIGTAGASQTMSSIDIGSVEPDGRAASGTLTMTPVVPGSVSLRVPLAGGIQFADQGDGRLRSVGVQPVRFGDIDYASGAWSVSLDPSQFSAGVAASASWSYLTGVETYPFEGLLAITEGHLREGDHWAFAYIDIGGTGTWDPGDPAGLPQGQDLQPIRVSWGEVPTVTFGLTEQLPGYQRFRWDAAEGQQLYNVRIVRQTSGDPLVFQRTGLRERTYIHEGDYHYLGLAGLPAGSVSSPGFMYFVEHKNYDTSATPLAQGQFIQSWPAALTVPELLSPNGQIIYARNDLLWSAHKDTVTVDVQIRQDSATGPVIFDGPVRSPHRRANGTYALDLRHIGLFAGDLQGLPNGDYVWRARALSPLTSNASAYSGWKAFGVRLRDDVPAPYSISGKVYYFGPTPGPHEIVVQAFRSPGFSGLPEAQVRLNGAGPYTLMGLHQDTYYVRAFINQNPTRLQPWESWGFVKDYEYLSDYQVKPIPVPGNKRDQQLVIRDRDTNQNGIPDSWEFVHGGLSGTSLADWESFLLGLQDSSGDGLTNAEKTALGLDPYRLDTHEDGIADVFRIVLGLDPTDPNAIPPATSLFQMVSVVPGAGGDLIQYDFDPAIIAGNVLTRPVRVRIAASKFAPGPYKLIEASARSVDQPDLGAGPFEFFNSGSTDVMHFYRLEWKLQ